MSFTGASTTISLASVWSSNGSLHLVCSSSPNAHSCPLQTANCSTHALKVSVNNFRGDHVPFSDKGFHGWFRSEGFRKGSRLVVAFSSIAEPSAGLYGEDVTQGTVILPGTDVQSITEWELDFCSRPIVDERGKRVWELLICDSSRSLQFAKYFPNNVINSLTLKDAMLSVVQMGLPKPQKVRFFRSQMTNIVTKACTELDIQAVPSRRCFSLIRWLDERYDSVYKKHPGFQENATPLLQLEESFPAELPDNLRGEQWAFVQLPLSGVMEEIAAVEQGDSFGDIFPLDVLGLELSPDQVIPGVAVASARATPLAAWTNALELASLRVDKQKKCLILTTGCLERWVYAYYRRSRQSDEEADAWEASKKACGGLHFLALQDSLESDACTGFWLLYDGPQSRI
ncbi:hypothetical protein KP509_12G043000 [Ceratopteris richardii]|uniref:Uncharacterized protein n=1 Tax=Ceratopteris richardii TaxID=49495 RepID=A0A8T2TRL4_CERRI|nr:hypothetical protein KP509_12G043000 [Ceratopteris richardii]